MLLGKVKGAVDDKRIDTALDGLFKKTKLEDDKTRIALLKTATTADLKRSKDPMIKLALALRPAHKAAEDRDKALRRRHAPAPPALRRGARRR